MEDYSMENYLVDPEKLSELLNKILENPILQFIYLFAFAVVLCFFIFPLVHSIYCTSIEELFMNKKKKFETKFFKALFLFILFLLANLYLSMNDLFVLISLFFAILSFIMVLVYVYKEFFTKKYLPMLNKLNFYYKEKKLYTFLLFIITIVPCLNRLLNMLLTDITIWGTSVIVSLFEVLLICIAFPVLNYNLNLYFIGNDNKRVYLYEIIDSRFVLCGYNVSIAESNSYFVMDFNKFKHKKIYNLRYIELSKKDKKKLRSTYKKLKQNIYCNLFQSFRS